MSTKFLNTILKNSDDKNNFSEIQKIKKKLLEILIIIIFVKKNSRAQGIVFFCYFHLKNK